MMKVFKAARDSDWSANHVDAHGVTLDEVREAILERPYWAAPAEVARSWPTAARMRAATCWSW